MLNQEDLQAIALLIKNEVEPIYKRIDNVDSRLDKIEETLEQVKEDGEITRTVTNEIGKWIDFYFSDDRPYPLDDEEIKKFEEGLKIAK